MTEDQEEDILWENVTAEEFKKTWKGKLFNVDPNNELSDQEYFKAVKQTRLHKVADLYTKVFNLDLIFWILFVGILLIILGYAIPIVQSLSNSTQQFAKQTYEKNVTIDNLRTIVHAIKESSNTLKEALNNAREFWDNA